MALKVNIDIARTLSIKEKELFDLIHNKLKIKECEEAAGVSYYLFTKARNGGEILDSDIAKVVEFGKILERAIKKLVA